MNFKVKITLYLVSIHINQNRVFYALRHYIREFRDFRRAPNGSGRYTSISIPVPTFVEKFYP